MPITFLDSGGSNKKGLTFGGISLPSPPTSSTTTMRSLLSAAGQTAYDSASVGNFFSCSSADYAAVFNGYADAQKIGNTDAIFNTALNAQYTATCASILTRASASISASSYIVGFACKFLNTQAGRTVTPLISTAHTGTYTAISNSPLAIGTSRVYYLRKDPPLTVSASFVGHVASSGDFDMASGSYNNSYYDCSSPYSSWILRSAAMPHFQMIVTTTKPY